MKSVLHLTQKEIRDLIVAGLKAKDFRTTGGVHITFVSEQDGTVGALVENMREATDEEREAEEPSKRRPLRRAPLEAEHDVAAAVAQRDTIDVFTGEEIPKGSMCLWIADQGVTVTHPSEWPEDVREKTGVDVDDPGFDDFRVESRGVPAPSNAAADILGGDGGVMSRGDALGEAVEDERPAAPRQKGARRRGRRVR